MIYCMYIYSRGWEDYALLLLKLITHTHSFIYQIFLNFCLKLGRYSDLLYELLYMH